jgi:guanylate kinase
MKNIVIVGTSGVGKTFLEQELETQKISYQIPKYTNRESRP